MHIVRIYAYVYEYTRINQSIEILPQTCGFVFSRGTKNLHFGDAHIPFPMFAFHLEDMSCILLCCIGFCYAAFDFARLSLILLSALDFAMLHSILLSAFDFAISFRFCNAAFDFAMQLSILESKLALCDATFITSSMTFCFNAFFSFVAKLARCNAKSCGQFSFSHLAPQLFLNASLHGWSITFPFLSINTPSNTTKTYYKTYLVSK